MVKNERDPRELSPHHDPALHGLIRVAAELKTSTLAHFAHMRLHQRLGRLHTHDLVSPDDAEAIPRNMPDILAIERRLREHTRQQGLHLAQAIRFPRSIWPEIQGLYQEWWDDTFIRERLLKADEKIFTPESFLFPEGVFPLLNPDKKVVAVATIVPVTPRQPGEDPRDMTSEELLRRVITDPTQLQGADFWFTSVTTKKGKDTPKVALWSLFLGVFDAAERWNMRAGFAAALSPSWKDGSDYHALWTRRDAQGYFADSWHKRIATIAAMGAGRDYADDREDPRGGVVENFMEVTYPEGVAVIPAGIVKVWNNEIRRDAHSRLDSPSKGPDVFVDVVI